MSLHLIVPFAAAVELIVRVSDLDPVTVVETSFVVAVNSILNEPSAPDPPLAAPPPVVFVPLVTPPIYPDPPPPAPSEDGCDGFPPPPP